MQRRTTQKFVQKTLLFNNFYWANSVTYGDYSELCHYTDDSPIFISSLKNSNFV